MSGSRRKSGKASPGVIKNDGGRVRLRTDPNKSNTKSGLRAALLGANEFRRYQKDVMGRATASQTKTAADKSKRKRKTMTSLVQSQAAKADDDKTTGPIEGAELAFKCTIPTERVHASAPSERLKALWYGILCVCL